MNKQDYHQLPFYHFSQDSLWLASTASIEKCLTPPYKSYRILDLCAGCGVVSLEFLQRIPSGKFHVVFCERQECYQKILHNNIKMFTHLFASTNILIDNLSTLISSSYHKSFDLILSNPPYFNAGEGRPSPNTQRDQCRTFRHDSWPIFLKTLLYTLKETGHAFFLCRHTNNYISHLWSQMPNDLTAHRHWQVIATQKNNKIIRVSPDKLLLEQQ